MNPTGTRNSIPTIPRVSRLPKTGPVSWSIGVARIARVEVKVHASFVLVLLLGAWQWGRPHGLRGALFGIVTMLLLFVCVGLHELGHALVARSFQLPADEIVLYPFGGAAQMDQDAPKPIQEILVAIAGPAVNVMIAAVLLVVTGAKLELAQMKGETVTRAALAQPSMTTLLVWLLSANVMMALFNMIPALPLDGGRVLRALLATKIGTTTATIIAAGLGQLVAVAFGILGVASSNYALALTALVIFIGATAEQKEPSRRSVLRSLRMGEVFNKNAIVLAPTDKVSTVVDHILTSYQPDFAVFDLDETRPLLQRRLVGIVTRRDVLDALSRDTRDLPVSAFMRPVFTRVSSEEPLEEVYARMTRESVPVVAVFDREQYLGLVSQDDVAEAKLVAGYVQRQTEAQIRA